MFLAPDRDTGVWIGPESDGIRVGVAPSDPTDPRVKVGRHEVVGGKDWKVED